jgi:hypothetical protein
VQAAALQKLVGHENKVFFIYIRDRTVDNRVLPDTHPCRIRICEIGLPWVGIQMYANHVSPYYVNTKWEKTSRLEGAYIPLWLRTDHGVVFVLTNTKVAPFFFWAVLFSACVIKSLMSRYSRSPFFHTNC